MCVITCYNVFNVWPKTTLLPVWRRDAKILDTPVRREKRDAKTGKGTQVNSRAAPKKVKYPKGANAISPVASTVAKTFPVPGLTWKH